MSKKYAKTRTRSRRKPARDPEGHVTRLDSEGAAVQLSLPINDILAGVHGAVREVCGTAGLLIMQALVDEEVEEKAGTKYKQDQDQGAVRWGQEESYFLLGGKKVSMKRPRLRKRNGREVLLERFRLFQRPARIEDEIEKQVILGVSTRNYAKAVDGVCDGYGVQKSSVSRHWKSVSSGRLAEFLERRLDELDLVALVIDGIEFHETLLIVAMGGDSTGLKHVLGLWQGASESAEVAKGLLRDLVRRGVDPEKKYLVVLDGSKGLHKAVRQVFGEQAEIQRCTTHKQRNVIDHLPKEHHRTVRMRLRSAWNMKDYEDAKSELLRLVRYLKDLNPSAARSLEEGLEETLTLHRLDAPDSLRRSLRTTNMIENCFSKMRHLCRNVKRWRAGDMAERWAGTMLVESEKKFRRLKGHRSMPKLLVALGRVVESARAMA